MPSPTSVSSPQAWEGEKAEWEDTQPSCPPCSGPWPASHLLGQPPREERVQVLGVQPQETFEVLPSDVVGLVLLLRELRQVLRLNGVALRGSGGSPGGVS